METKTPNYKILAEKMTELVKGENFDDVEKEISIKDFIMSLNNLKLYLNHSPA